jgi:exonuclease III
LSSFNCKNVRTSVDEIRELCNTCDVILLQETWLTSQDLPYLNTLDERCYSMGVSAMSTEDSVLRGRPHGGLGIMWNKRITHMCKIIEYEDCRILGIEINSDNKKILILNIYLPYDNGDNMDEYIFYLHKINTIVGSYPSTHVYIYGDFNAHCNSLMSPPHHRFGRETTTIL